jgi:hypothetical protein
MPKVEIDYSNTIFYKIFCKDTTIKDLYVGLTTNFVQRKHAHKQSCKNEKALNHKCKLYNAIRKAGGWDNWQMEIIAFHNCADSYEARKKEQGYFEALGATLNSIDPFPKPKIKEPPVKIVKEKKLLFCEPCNVHFAHWTTQENHNNTKKHDKMVEIHDPTNPTSNGTEIKQTFSKKYWCETCDYTTDKKYNLEKHFLTLRHLKTTNNNDFVGKSSKKLYICEKCEKVYNDRAGLWRHNKKCDIVHFENNSDNNLFNKNVDDSHVKLLTNMVLEVVKQNKELACQNQELQKHMIELCKMEHIML